MVSHPVEGCMNFLINMPCPQRLHVEISGLIFSLLYSVGSQRIQRMFEWGPFSSSIQQPTVKWWSLCVMAVTNMLLQLSERKATCAHYQMIQFSSWLLPLNGPANRNVSSSPSGFCLLLWRIPFRLSSTVHRWMIHLTCGQWNALFTYPPHEHVWWFRVTTN